MKNKRTVAKVAAVALALSALASPLAANAATVATAPLSNAYTAALTAVGEGGPLNAGTVSAVIATAANGDSKASAVPAVQVRLSDPLALAKQYAPDTVQAWKQTLAAFDKLRKDTVTFTAAGVTAAGTTAGASIDGWEPASTLSPAGNPTFTKVSTGDGKTWTITNADGSVSKVTAGSAEELPSTTASIGQPIPPNGIVKGLHYVTTVKGEGLLHPVVFKDAVKLSDSVAAVHAGTIAITKAEGADGSAFEIHADGPIDDPFFNGQIALAKAADSKDAAAIKEALAKLLELYKAEIVKLQAE